MAGQVRREEILAKAVIIDGRKEWYCRGLLRDECVDKVEMSKVPNIPSMLEGKYKHAVSAKAERSWSDSSSLGEFEAQGPVCKRDSVT